MLCWGDGDHSIGHAPKATKVSQAVTVCMSCECSRQDLFLGLSLAAIKTSEHLLFSVLKNPGIIKIIFDSGVVMKLLQRVAPGCAPNSWRGIRDPLLGSWLLTTSQTDDISFETLCKNHGLELAIKSKPGTPEEETKTKLRTLSQLWLRISRLVRRPRVSLSC